MEFLRNFKNINKRDVLIAGGKGASLGEMTQTGIPVPAGFVILSTAFEKFLEETDLSVEIDSILESVNYKEIHTVENASEKIKALILSAEIPKDITDEIQKFFKNLNSKYVAVRSSATAEDSASAAWAGQLESYLNTTEENLLENVKKCWASLFTPRAIFYRFEKGLHEQKISVAVVVQKMIESESSGIAFSVHPVTQDRNQLIIEAGFGLGEAIVSGQITPDSYVVEKQPRRIIDKNIQAQSRGLYRAQNPPAGGGGNEWRNIPKERGEKQVLSDAEILELSEIILRIESHYKFPCDIEWAFEKNKFYIVQSRPITTLTEQPQQTFVKAYTRNFSIIMQQAWFAANKENLIPKLGLQEYPHNPPYLYFMKEGVEEVWENTKANHWLLEKLVEKFKSDNKFFPELYKRYFDRLAEVEKWWKKEIKDIDDLEKFIGKVYDGVSDFVVIYGALMDERVPKDIKEIAEKFREKDVFFAECNAAIWRALKNIYPKLGYLAVYITRDELGKKIDIEELKQRDKGFALIPGIFQGAISFDNLINKFPEYRFEIERGEQDKNGLKGQVAYQGKVSGKVRIVKRTDQAEKVIDGEIIVSPMTTPDFAPAMKRAAGFVTDEGGITCHAAIIAREMKKPCVIGTKIATQVLKDGDLVEVDADKGMVRILETKDYAPDDYVRMFAGKSFVYILTDIFLTYYNTLGVLSIQDKETWISFLPKKSEEKTLQEGKELYTSKEKYDEYSRRFHEYIKSSTSFFQSILEKDVVSADEARKFFELVSNHFSFYSKTEFFYTDLLDQDKIALSVQEFDKLKLDGRLYLNKIIFEEKGYVRSLLKKLSIQKTVSESDLLSYSTSEIVELIKSNKKVDENELAKRHTFFASEKLTLFGDESKELVNKFLSIYRDISDTITGTIANEGKVRGKARVFNPDFRDFDKIAATVEEMERGEILVAETTAPEIIQACKKAAAIITNQGGMLSHAAIVSRELGIPCIVGTDKDVILNIKTGDELEVDANKGVIRIYKK